MIQKMKKYNLFQSIEKNNVFHSWSFLWHEANAELDKKWQKAAEITNFVTEA
jgi:hypothetical protein